MRLKTNQLKIGILLSYVSKIVSILIGLTYTPIMIRLLGQSEYGLYNIAASVIAYLGILNLGFGSAYMRYYSRYKTNEEKDKIAVLNGMFLTIFSVLGLIVVLSGILLAFNVDIIFGTSLNYNELDITKKMMFILVINLAVSFPSIVYDTYLQANERFVIQNGLTIIRQITTPLINLPILLLGYGSIGMVLGTTLVNVLVQILTIVYCIKTMEMQFSFKKIDKVLMKEITVYSSFIFVNMIVDQINNNLDKTILGRYQGSLSVAIYSLAAYLNVYYQQIVTIISNVFIPRVHRMVALNVPNLELTKLLSRVGRIQFLLSSFIFLGFLFFGRPFIGFWAGEEYYSSYYITLLLMLAVSIPIIQNISLEVQRAKNMHGFRSMTLFLIALINLLISIPLANRYGAIGVAFGTAISMILGNGPIMNWFNHNKINLDMKYFWKEIFKLFPALLIPVFYGLLTNNLINIYKIQNLFICGFFYIFIYVLSIWFLGMNNDEKSIIKDILNKLTTRFNNF